MAIKIRLKRTEKTTAGQLDYGEPLYVKNDSLIIGDGDSSHGITAYKKVKLVAPERAAKGLFYSTNKNNVVTVTDVEGTKLKIDAGSLTMTEFTGATATKNGTSGIVPAPKKGEQTYFLKADGTWQEVKTLNVTENSTAEKVCITGIITTDLNAGLQYNKNVYVNCKTGVLMGAAWNDYAEYRECKAKAGTVVYELGDGKLAPATKRLQKGCSIISDTFGMVIGKEGKDYSPVAVSGRVLANIEPGDYFEPGDAVCAEEGGKISRMTKREIRRYPDRIIGYVSEIPTYEEWNGVKVNNRIWIKVK